LYPEVNKKLTQKLTHAYTHAERHSMSERRSSIELTEILALRFECKKCKSVLVVSPEKYSKWEEQTRQERQKLKPALTDCPVCGEEWISEQLTVTEFVKKLIAMRRRARGIQVFR